MVMKNRDTKWLNFLKSQGRSPANTRPFYRRLNKMANEPDALSIPVLLENDLVYDTDESKANLFKEKLKKTFNENNSTQFDENFKDQIDRFVDNKELIDSYKDKKYHPFTLKELNKAINDLTNKPSLDSSGISNIIIKNFHVEAKMDF